MKLTQHRPDFILFFVILLLVSIGLLSVYSASMIWATQEMGKPADYFFLRQLIWSVFGLASLLVTMNVPYWKWKKLLTILLPVSLLTLLAVFLFPRVGGAHRWILVGPLSFQPSELATLTVIVYLAHLLAKKKEKLHNFKKGVFPPLLVMILFAGIIIIEPAMDAAGLLAATGMVMMYVAGTPKRHLAKLIVPGGVLAAAFILLSSYRRARLLALADPFSEENIRQFGFQQANSLFAIASGGWSGTGLGRSIEKFLYLPEPHTDFIFAILSEEWGTFGGIALIALFGVLVWRAMRISSRLQDSFGALIAVGIAGMIGFAVLANIGMVSGMLPVIGIPLPLISYGGSALLVKMSGLGLLLNLSRYTEDEEI